MISALIVAASLVDVSPAYHASVFEAHDRQPTAYGVVTRSSCHDSDDADHDCEDSVPVDGGWAPTLVLGLGALYVFTRRRRGL